MVKWVRGVVGGVLQPLSERIYDPAPRVGKPVGDKPTLQQRLLRSGLRLRSGEFLALQLGCVGVAALLGGVRFGFGFQILVMAVAAYFAPGIYVRMRMNKRQGQFSQQLPEVLMQISNAMRAGISLPMAMAQVAGGGRGPIAEEFTRVNKEIALGGAPEEVLGKMVRRVGNADLELMVIAISINRRVGGNLAEVMESIAETIRERVKIKGDVKTLTTQARVSGYVITGLPVLLAVGLYFFMPTYFIPMTQNIIGLAALGVGAVLLGIGNLIMRKIVSIEV
jgi:tight adherence protein B